MIGYIIHSWILIRLRFYRVYKFYVVLEWENASWIHKLTDGFLSFNWVQSQNYIEQDLLNPITHTVNLEQ